MVDEDAGATGGSGLWPWAMVLTDGVPDTNGRMSSMLRLWGSGVYLAIEGSSGVTGVQAFAAIFY